MKNLLACLGLLLAVSTSGCVLYLGEENAINDCPPGTFPGTDENGFDACIAGGGGGWDCDDDSDCAGGCYCDETLGECVEAGYCDPAGDAETQCGFNMECDCSSSCVPADTATRTCGNSCVETGCPTDQVCDPTTGACVPVTPPGCQSDADCAAGQTCDAATGTCVTIPPPGCQSDADCGPNEVCNPTNGVCDPANPPACNGPLTCADPAPACPPGEVPLIHNGCWLNVCIPLNSCGVSPPCNVLNIESQCLENVGCSPVYSGQNCTSPDGNPCSMGQSGCTCETFTYERCEAE